MNTRIMTLEDYDAKLDAEAAELRISVPQMRAELYRDPEGCFGGRGNNIGQVTVENAEARLGWLANQGYTIRTHPYIDLLQAGIDLSTIEKVIAKDNAIFVGGTEGHRCKKTLKSSRVVEVNWRYDRNEESWGDEEPPQEIIEAAEAVAAYYGSTLLEWRGEFHCPRRYL